MIDRACGVSQDIVLRHNGPGKRRKFPFGPMPQFPATYLPAVWFHPKAREMVSSSQADITEAIAAYEQ